jgi:hypothetical protein
MDSVPSVAREATLNSLLEQRVGAADLGREMIPASPGIYAWFEGEVPFFVGTAKDLRHRIYDLHLSRPRGAKDSALRRAIAEHLGFGNTTDLRAGRRVLSDDEQSQVFEWLKREHVSWIVCTNESEALDLALSLSTT